MKFVLMIFARQSPRLLLFLLLAGYVAIPSAVSVLAQEEEEFTQETSRPDDTREDPAALFNLGQDFHAKGDFEKALEFYRKALALEPDFPEAEYQQGIILESIGNPVEAISAFRRALALRDNWAAPYFELGLALLKRGEYSEAAKFLGNGFQLEPGNYSPLSAAAEILLTRDSPKSALEVHLSKLSEITSMGGVPVSIWISKSAIERKLGNIVAARNSLISGLGVDNLNENVLANLAEIDLNAGEYESAITYARKIVDRDPVSRIGLLVLARTYLAKGERDRASEVLDKIKNPGKDVLELRAAISANENDSVASLEGMLITDPDNPAVLGRLCSASRTIDPKKALDYCKRALEIEKDSIDHAIGYGAALVQLKQYGTASAVLKNLLRHSPENYVIHANLATALFQMEDFETAKTEYRWIVEKEPKLAVAYYFLAISHDRLREYEDALVNYNKFLSLAGADEHKLEIEKVNLRLPILEGQIKRGMGRKSSGSFDD